MLNPKIRQRVAYIVALAAALAGAWLCGEFVKADAGIWPGASNGMLARMCRAWTPESAACTSAAGKGAAVMVPVVRIGNAQGLELQRMRVPVAFLGLGYFVAGAVWLVMVGAPRRSDPALCHALRVMACAGCLGSIVLILKMVTGGSGLCVGCALAHALNFAFVLAVFVLGTNRAVGGDEHPGAVAAMRRERTRLAIVAAGVALAAVAGLGYHRHEQLALARNIHNLTPYRELVVSLRADGDALRRDHYAAPTLDIAPSDAAAADSIVVFMDYACSACRCNDRKLHTLVERAFGNAAHVDVRHLPRCRACAEGTTPGPHADGCAAACAAEAARVMGGDTGFHKMHQRLLAERGPWTDERLGALAVQIGLDATDFQAAMRGDAVQARLAADRAAAQAAGVEGVPAVFLDGRRVGPLSVDNPVFWKAVAADRGCPAGDSVAGLDFANP